jgi:hypothetical protein
MLYENRVLRAAFGPKGEEVTGNLRKFHNEELHNSYSSPVTIIINSGRMTWTGHVARTGEKRHAYRVPTGEAEENRPLET